jgi:hypothetical protein
MPATGYRVGHLSQAVTDGHTSQRCFADSHCSELATHTSSAREHPDFHYQWRSFTTMFGPNSSSSIASATDHLRTPEQGRLARTTCRYHLPLSDCESHGYQTILFVPTETQETMIEITTYSRLPFPYTASTVFKSYLA